MIRRLWKKNRPALIAFGVALCALGYFGVKTVAATIYWMDPAHQEQPLAGWMTPRYVAQSYGLPREYMAQALFFDLDAPPRRVSLDKIADENGVTLQDLQVRIDAAVAEWRATPEGAAGND